MSRYNFLSVIGIIYTAFLILSNITASKIVQMGNLHFTAPILFFPLTYIIDDIITEVYGFKASRRIIWVGMLANLIVVVGCFLIVKMPPSDQWHNQEAFEKVFGLTPRIFIASVVAYFIGGFINSIVLAKLKVYFAGKYFWIRALGSTAFGALADTMLFMFIAFALLLPAKLILSVVLVEYIIKIAVEILVLPITYKVANLLKKYEGIDYYDKKTKFSIFSLKVD